jgi:hypothetical protein
VTDTGDRSDRFLDAVTSIRTIVGLLGFCLFLAAIIWIINQAWAMPDRLFWILALGLPIAAVMTIVTLVVGIVTNWGRARV